MNVPCRGYSGSLNKTLATTMQEYNNL